LSPKFDKCRSVCIDSLFFNADGTIQKVIPTIRGIGVTNATKNIQIDRYSHKSEYGSSIEFNDPLCSFNGWKTILSRKNSWIQYNVVDFGKEKLRSVQVRAFSEKGSIIEIRLEKTEGQIISEVKIPGGKALNTIETEVSKIPHGIHNLILVLKDDNPVEIDWVSFK